MIAGRYSLDREIGRGGSGVVWLGRDEVLHRPVALKRLGLVPGTTEPDGDRADREARLAARLSDPHVVAVFDLVGEGPDQWLVMEYVDGRNLADLVRATGPLPPARAAALLGQAAGALAVAHAAGIVHRDVKPSNILVAADGGVKLTDFGIARAESDVSLTRTGLVTGSPAYLAPEVASGRTATAASDVWSWGATLFHALTGHPPYDIGDNVLGALYRIVHDDPPRTDRAGWLGAVLEGTMVRDPARRWTMSQVRDHLAAGPAGNVRVLPSRGAAAPTAEHRPSTSTAARATRRPTWLLGALLAVGMLVLVLIAGVALAGGHGSQGDARGELIQPRTGVASTPSTPPTPPTGPSPLSRRMVAFVRGYLAGADTDPADTFDDLTPGFQVASKGRTGYLGFWRDVSILRIDGVTADPAALTVSYTYLYRHGHRRPVLDHVRLRLERQGQGFLIADEV